MFFLKNALPNLGGWIFVALVVLSLLFGIELSTHIARRSLQAFVRAVRWLIQHLLIGLRAYPIAASFITSIVIILTLLVTITNLQTPPILRLTSTPIVWAIFVALALTAIPFYLNRAEVSALPQVFRVKSSSRRTSLLFLSAGIIGFLIIVEADLDLLHIPGISDLTTNQQAPLLIVSIVLVTLGTGGVHPFPPIPQLVLNFLRPSVKAKPVKQAARVQAHPLHDLAVLSVLLLAFALRFWHLNDLNRVYVDELNHVFAINDLANNQFVPLLAPFSSVAAFPYTFPYGQWLSVEIFGHNYIGIRAFSAVIGTLTVAAVYQLGRSLFDSRTALIAALLLATFPPHMHFSRLGLNNIADPLFGTLALAFLARGMRFNRRIDWAVGGAMLGLTHYFYEAGRLLYTPLVLVWIIGAWWLSRPAAQPSMESKGSLIRRVRGLIRRPANAGAALVALIVVAAPIYLVLIGMDRPIAARMVDNQIGLTGDYWRLLFQYDNFQAHIEVHVIPALAVFINGNDPTLFYAGKSPLMLPFVELLFLLGLAYLLWRWRAPGALLLLLWMASTAAGNSLMTDSTTFTRFIIVFPGIMLVTALGINHALPLLLPRKRLYKFLMVMLPIAFAVLQVYYYFAVHLPTYAAETRADWGHPDAEDAILRSLDFPSGTQIHFVSQVQVAQNYNQTILAFSRPDLTLETLTPYDLTPEYFRRLRCGIDHVFFLVPNDWDSLGKIRQEFFLRQAVMSPYQDIPVTSQFALYYAPYWIGNDRPFHHRCGRD